MIIIKNKNPINERMSEQLDHKKTVEPLFKSFQNTGFES